MLDEIPLSGCTTVYFTYSLLEGHLGCFQVLEQPHAGFGVDMFSIPLDKYQGVQFLGNMVEYGKSMFNFFKKLSNCLYMTC